VPIPPWNDHRARVDGKELELFVADILRSLGEGLSDFRLEEQEVIAADDGVYRIDVTARFTALSMEFLVLVECKDHARPVEREDVQVLADKKRTAGAQKGCSLLDEWLSTWRNRVRAETWCCAGSRTRRRTYVRNASG